MSLVVPAAKASLRGGMANLAPPGASPIARLIPAMAWTGCLRSSWRSPITLQELR
jgi:hypothetical protein